MTPFQIFITASVIVILALVFSLILWTCIITRSVGYARWAAVLFALCFFLYTIGQTLVVLQVTQMITWNFDLSSYLYALASLVFAVGSWYQYKSIPVSR